MFKKAERKKAKLRLALSGPSGSGKTTGALLIARGLGGRIAVLDTERGSASLYADIVDFDVVELGPPYTPERYIDVIRAAEKAGYDTLVLDSITHEWNGSGGILEIVDSVAKAKFRNNTYAAWNEGTPRHQKFIDAMLASTMHIIATIRSKAAYVETEKANGKKSIEKQGAAPQQRDGLEYEFTAVLDICVDGNFANASKDRTRLFRDPFVITEATGQALRNWLESGVEATQQQQQNTSPQQRQSQLSQHVVTLDDAMWEFMQCNDLPTLNATAKRLQINKDNPQYAAIHAAYAARLDDLKGQGANPDGSAPRAITPAQRTAIMAYYGKRGMASDDKRDARLADLSSFCGRAIASVNDITFDEALDYIEAINADRSQEAA